AAIVSVKGSLSGAAHLQYEEMESYLDGEAPPEVRATVEAHMGICTRCAREITDLRSFKSMPIHAPVPQEEVAPRGWLARAFGSPVYQVAAAALILIATIAIYRFSFPPAGPAAPDILNSAQTPAPTKVPIAELKDGPRRISVTSSAGITGLDSFPREYRGRIEEALIADHFERPSVVESTWAQNELSTARAKFADSHLLLGILDIHAGHTYDARTEFSALLDENPGSPLATALMRKLDELAK
ncbi:MAG: anti-sigma factor family protein, partial [Bryobacteraceae bacterium]